MHPDTITISVELPRTVLSILRQDAPELAAYTHAVAEMRLAAAVKWYEMQLISQSKAAEVAGLSRAEFLNALGRFNVSPFQYNADELIAEITHE